MRIAAFIDECHPSAPYRGLHPLEELIRRGHQVNAFVGNRTLPDMSPEDVARLARRCDVAFISRFIEPSARRLARQLHDAGLPVVWDFDDDAITWRVEGCSAMARSADVVTTTNSALAGRHRARGARHVVVVPNYVTCSSIDVQPRGHDGVVLGYIGWSDHQEDWDKLKLARVVRRLLRAHPDLRVVSVGPLDLRLPAERYRALAPMGFDQLPPVIAEFNIGIAPLINKPGAATRSDIKLKEYAILGVPWLASPLGPYVGLGEEQGGRLVPAHAWAQEIERLVVDGEARRALAERGRAWAEQHTLERNVDAWREAFEHAIEVGGQRGVRAAAR
jgi:glycosyltransferase involved in cell wall biosynthesis